MPRTAVVLAAAVLAGPLAGGAGADQPPKPGVLPEKEPAAVKPVAVAPAAVRRAVVVAPPAAVPPPAAPQLDLFVDNEQGAAGPLVRQQLRAELHLLRAVADPTRQQFEAVEAASEAALRKAGPAVAQRLQNRGGSGGDPRKVVTDAVLDAARQHLSGEQVGRYLKDWDLRVTARKKAMVANIVLLLDGVLVLAPDQRDKVTAVLADNWNDAWHQTMYFWNAGQFFPPLPDAKLRPLLTPAQRTVWDGIARHQVHFGVSLEPAAWANLPAENWPAGPPAPKPATVGPGAGGKQP